MNNEDRIAQLEAAIVRWAKQVDELEVERDRLKQELQDLQKRYTDIPEDDP